MANTLRGFPPPPAPVPAPVAAQPLPASAPAALPVANPATGMAPVAGTNPNPVMQLSPLGKLAQRVGLLSYGMKGLTPRAAASLGAIGLAIIACAVFEVVLNFRSSGMLFAHESPVAKWIFRLIFMAVLGTLIYVIDISWAGRDRDSNSLKTELVKPPFFSRETLVRILHFVFGASARGFYVRMTVLLILTIFNSMAGHVSFFMDEVEHEFKRRENENFALIVDRAIAKEAPAYQNAIDDARDAMPPVEGARIQRENPANRQPACYSLRCQQRAERVRRNTAEEDRLRARIRTIQVGNDRENESGRGGRPPGRGQQWTRGQNEERSREAAYEATRTQNQTNLDAFDTETRQQLNAATTAWASKQAEIRSTDRARLAQQYSMTWEVSRGILEVLKTLYALLWHNTLMLVIAIVIAFVIQVPTMIVIGSGYLLFVAASDYLSPAFQAANGNQEVRDALALKGIVNPEELIVAPEIRELRGEHLAVCAAINVEVRNLTSRMGIFCQKNPDGTWPTHRTVLDRGQREWNLRTTGLIEVRVPDEVEAEEGAEIRHEVGKVDRLDVVNLTVGHNGAKALKWPETLNEGRDPRIVGQEPWRVSKAFLADQFGWEDPEKDRPEQERWIEEIKRNRRGIIQALMALDAYTVSIMSDPLARVVSGSDHRLIDAPLMVVRMLRAAWWNENGQSLYRALAIAETNLLEVGGIIPHWRVATENTAIVVEPRDYKQVQRYVLFITDKELRTLHGGSAGLNPDWTADVPRRPAPPAQVAPAPVTNGSSKANGHDADGETITPDDLTEVDDDAKTGEVKVMRPAPPALPAAGTVN